MDTRALIGLVIAVAFICVGCEAESTPVAAVNSTTSAASTPAAITTIGATTSASTPASTTELRYGLLESAAGFRAMLETNYDVVDVNPDNFPPVDIVLAVGYVEGWQQTPVEIAHYVAVQDTLPPLDNPDLAEIVSDALAAVARNIQPEPTDIRAIRTRLANAGFPDGIEINLYAESAAYAEPLFTALETLNIRTQQTLTVNSAHIRLYISEEPADDTLIYRLPLSFRVLNPDVTVTFGELGIPEISPTAP